MILIQTNYANFKEYLDALSPSARQNYRYVQKYNADLVYEWVKFDKMECEHFMRLWERQLVRGKPIQWAFTIGHIASLADNKSLICFRARKHQATIAYHFVQRHTNIIECHPPMYEKSAENNKRYLAKFMWLQLIRYAIANHLDPLDLGGGPNNFREHILNRAKYPNPTYKWMYVPERVKRFPQELPNYELKIINEQRHLTII